MAVNRGGARADRVAGVQAAAQAGDLRLGEATATRRRSARSRCRSIRPRPSRTAIMSAMDWAVTKESRASCPEDMSGCRSSTVSRRSRFIASGSLGTPDPPGAGRRCAKGATDRAGEFVRAIRSVADGDAVIARSVTGRLLDAFAQSGPRSCLVAMTSSSRSFSRATPACAGLTSPVWRLGSSGLRAFGWSGSFTSLTTDQGDRYGRKWWPAPSFGHPDSAICVVAEAVRFGASQPSRSAVTLRDRLAGVCSAAVRSTIRSTPPRQETAMPLTWDFEPRYGIEP
jgi:hypothetical protein